MRDKICLKLADNFIAVSATFHTVDDILTEIDQGHGGLLREVRCIRERCAWWSDEELCCGLRSC